MGNRLIPLLFPLFVVLGHYFLKINVFIHLFFLIQFYMNQPQMFVSNLKKSFKALFLFITYIFLTT